MQDHFIGAVLVLAMLGIILGIIAVYLIAFILAIHEIMSVVYGVGYG